MLNGADMLIITFVKKILIRVFIFTQILGPYLTIVPFTVLAEVSSEQQNTIQGLNSLILGEAPVITPRENTKYEAIPSQAKPIPSEPITNTFSSPVFLNNTELLSDKDYNLPELSPLPIGTVKEDELKKARAESKKKNLIIIIDNSALG